jgi:hypothetical protein
MNANEYEITNGFISSFGVSYKAADPETLCAAIAAAAERNGKSEAEIKAALERGEHVAWCDSPNYYYDHGVGYIRRKRIERPVQLVRCSCGHEVEPALVMNASLGTSCPDCYDRLSD